MPRYKVIANPFKRKVPRPFKLPFGKGVVLEEVSAKCPHWEPTIQVLQFEGGERALRFCVYDNNKFARMPPILGEEEIALLGRLARRTKHLRKMLRRLSS